MKPAVSIIVPSYNHARYVKPCVEGVLIQSFQDWELIVVDDGSKDESVELWRSYKDPRIQVHVNPQNMGTYPTQNRAVELSQADLVAVLNDDDIWEPEKLEKQVAMLKAQPDAPLCYTLGWLADDDGKLDKVNDHHKDWPQEERHDVFPYLLEVNRILASSVVFRRQHAYFEPSLKYSGDWYALLRASYLGPVACVPERLSHWRIHAEGAHFISFGVYSEDLRFREAMWRHSADWLASGRDPKLIKAQMGRHALHVAALYILYGCPWRARVAALSALRWDPERRAAVRRFIGCCLPLSVARKHLWPAIKEGYPKIEVDALPKIDFKLRNHR